MGFNTRAKRDGSGPHKDSYRRKSESKPVGRRQAAGQPCPFGKQ